MSTALSKFARVGVPLVVVEKDGGYAWREQPSEHGLRTVKIGRAQFAALRRLYTRQKSTDREPSGPALETTVKWDTATGTYELNRIELGLFGRLVWLMHKQPETDDDHGTIGIQLKKEW